MSGVIARIGADWSGSTVSVPISPIRLHTGGKSEIRRPAPTLGQDTNAVLGELLGLKAEELAKLHDAGVTVPVTERKKA